MGEVSLINLPVELHTSILMFLLSLSRKPSPGARELFLRFGITPLPGPDPLIWGWTEQDSRSGSLFPFNAARVCKLWRNILARIPECWTRVVFDVVSHPGYILDAFAWSRNLENIEVVVFSSSEYTEDVDKGRERRHVLAIAQALQHHVHRCKSITFDIVYSSSLPPPTFFFLHDAPKLEQLILECRINNFDLSSHVPSPNLDGEQIPFATSFTALGKLSTPAFWLIDMQLSSPDPEWFSKLNCLKMDVTVTKFEFPQSGQYSVTNFLRCLSELRVPASIFLQDLYLSYEFFVDNLNSPDRTHPAYTFSGADTYFKSVSKDFIAQFYALANVVSAFMLSFEDCEIPNISHLQCARNICLENIVDDQGQSLRNVLAAWEGSYLTIYSCPSFNDTFLSWLRSIQEYIRIDTEGNRVLIKAYPAENLSSLQIDDCVNFTAPALMEVVKFRSDNHAAYLELGKTGSDKHLYTDSIDSVSVTGRGPPFTLEDMSLHWLNDKIDILRVTWNMVDDEGEEHWYRQGDEE